VHDLFHEGCEYKPQTNATRCSQQSKEIKPEQNKSKTKQKMLLLLVYARQCPLRGKHSTVVAQPLDRSESSSGVQQDMEQMYIFDWNNLATLDILSPFNQHTIFNVRTSAAFWARWASPVHEMRSPLSIRMEPTVCVRPRPPKLAKRSAAPPSCNSQRQNHRELDATAKWQATPIAPSIGCCHSPN
jgi:hypothetical protein